MLIKWHHMNFRQLTSFVNESEGMEEATLKI